MHSIKGHCLRDKGSSKPSLNGLGSAKGLVASATGLGAPSPKRGLLGPNPFQGAPESIFATWSSSISGQPLEDYEDDHA